MAAIHTMDTCLGIGAEIEPPPRLSLTPAVHRQCDEVGTIVEVAEGHTAFSTCASTDGCDMHLAPADSPPGREVAAVPISIPSDGAVRLVKHRGYGHHTLAALITMCYVCCAGITIELPTNNVRRAQRVWGTGMAAGSQAWVGWGPARLLLSRLRGARNCLAHPCVA